MDDNMDMDLKKLLTSFCTELIWLSGVPRGDGGTLGVFNPPPPKFRSFDKAEPNSQFRGKYIRNNLIRIRSSLICKLSGTPRGLSPSDLRSLCPLSSPEFVEPPRTKFLGTPLVWLRMCPLTDSCNTTMKLSYIKLGQLLV
jgi:hypothetical protein